MIISQLADIIFEFYSNGRVKSTNTSFSKQDAEQFAKFSFSDIMRRSFRDSMKDPDGPDYYFYSPILAIKRFVLSDEDNRGVRRADTSAFDAYTLQKNAHITNVYPVCSACKNIDSFEITQVEPAEENFYLSPDMQFFKFYVVKGKGLNFYHLEPCVKSVDVEMTFADGDVDVPLDMCYNVANATIQRMLGIPAFTGRQIDNPYSEQQVALKAKINPQQQSEP